jgi:hypothetical protein
MKLTEKEKKLIRKALRLLDREIYCTLCGSDEQDTWYRRLELDWTEVRKLTKKI